MVLEHLVYIQRVIGSNPISSTNGYQSGTHLSETGGYGDNKIGNWEYRIAAIAADCKSALIRVRRFESYYSHNWNFGIAGAYVGLKIQRNKFDSYRFRN